MRRGLLILAVVMSALINPMLGLLAMGIAVMALSAFALYGMVESMKIATYPLPMW